MFVHRVSNINGNQIKTLELKRKSKTGRTLYLKSGSIVTTTSTRYSYFESFDEANNFLKERKRKHANN